MDCIRQELRYFKSRRGQGIVEYLLMLSVIVGVVLVIGKMFKPQIAGVFTGVMDKIQKAAESVGGTGGGY
ncbi:MAG: hypothetical protein HYZ75_13750 [Elusimicrobia bacterium]|nr:hypothetical protein [Elusimicrobiota bacterium]